MGAPAAVRPEGSVAALRRWLRCCSGRAGRRAAGSSAHRV